MPLNSSRDLESQASRSESITYRASIYRLILLVTLGLLGWAQVIPNVWLVPLATILVIIEFLERIDCGLPLIQMTALIAVLQWILGPLLVYQSEHPFGRYRMYVEEQTYFQFAIPATLFYAVAMLAIGRVLQQRALMQSVDRTHFVKIGCSLMLVGVIATIAAPRFSGSYQFLFFMLSQAMYVGSVYFLMSKHEWRLLLALAPLSFLLIASLNSGRFHDLLIWSAVLFCYWFAQRKFFFLTKVAIFASILLLVFGIQSVKNHYRTALKRGDTPSLVSLMRDHLQPGGLAWEEGAVSNAMVRLNQGWIVSAVMNHVPQGEPFAQGETVKDAFVSALLPRFIAPDKKGATGRENFRRFTGLEIGESTTMAISPLGEVYANFGVAGGILALTIYGVIFSSIYAFFVSLLPRFPTFYFWLPFIFYQSIKAETEFVVTVNQLAKGTIVALVLYYFIKRNFPTSAKHECSKVHEQYTPDNH
ncbi:MAG: hypothetical protein JNK90_04215 [Planctomycetaceae bacterium]|nr:hypothetical protein [Planctomycetaceae bacterium]